ncbi:hypothetical protein [Hyunsoonleella ulvae]|uniref:hypothetical protein n=1 Tax=Hyunsoonleella ulvae TaxID=2799948 RepID=UPI001939F0AA|nr:hypothetical protein [Hyunsoonleella ulvae]
MKNYSFRAIYLCLGLLLVANFSCSNDEELLETEQEVSEQEPLIKNDETLSARTKGNKISGCDNPKGYRIYTVGELSGLSDSDDYVSKTAINGTGVDVMRDLDDRTCAFNYEQEKRGAYEYGKYKLKAGSNEYDNLQPRIERTTKKVDRKNGNFVSVEGYVRIRRVGNKPSGNNFSKIDMRDKQGTYIMQAKGTHYNKTIGSDDPAIALLVAKAGANGSFDIYREQITKRGGSGVDGRKLVFLKNVPGDRRVKVKMVNGWNTSTRQYVEVTISGSKFSWNVPNTLVEINGTNKYQTGRDAKIRFGAYRCHAGEADIWWSDVKHNFKG